jgi:hypothetical protein
LVPEDDGRSGRGRLAREPGRAMRPIGRAVGDTIIARVSYQFAGSTGLSTVQINRIPGFPEICRAG